MNAIYQEDYKGFNIKIYQDGDAESPREVFDNFGKMVCFHNRYNLGDKTDLTIDEINEHVKRKDVVSLPLYLYDHSGITINTTGFSCPWDSGQVGYIYADRADILSEYGGKILTKKLRSKIEEYLKNEVSEYDQFLRGEVYGYNVTKPVKCDSCGNVEAEDIGSCWGFYGDYEGYILEEARSTVDYEVNK